MARSAHPRPNPLAVAWSVLRARRVKAPEPAGSLTVDHSALAPTLAAVRSPSRLAGVDVTQLDWYLKAATDVEPDTLSRDEALAFWINLYNARAIRLALDAFSHGLTSVLRVPGAFDVRDLEVDGERLSLTDIEHGKIRRFRDSRVHGSLVCGSLSCPTLSLAPFSGAGINRELDTQMRSFLGTGGAFADQGDSTLYLSRIFLWYGADFVKPHRMPALIPARRRQIASAVKPWMSPELAAWFDSARPRVVFQAYDWALGCGLS